jgi:acetylornithine deacetylase/succinyl-diaminopimelate desuccinylase-like protein
LESAGTAPEAANQIRLRQVELAALLRTTISPTMLNAGTKINVIPNTAQARVDIRRLPDESRAEVLDRIRRIVNDSAVEVTPAGGQEMPPAEPSSLTTSLYIAMERVFRKHHPKAVVLPYMALGATDGAFLRSKGMAVYGVPVFVREENASRAHGNDERISLKTMDEGTALLMEIVASVVQ